MKGLQPTVARVLKECEIAAAAAVKPESKKRKKTKKSHVGPLEAFVQQRAVKPTEDQISVLEEMVTFLQKKRRRTKK